MKTSGQRGIVTAEKREIGTVSMLKQLLGRDELKRRFSDILGEKAPQFMASIINATAANDKLQECDPHSILSSALVAATLDLPIDNSLGFAAIVPYGGKAQFQIMWKGLVQLAQRSGQYRTMGRGVVFEDEIENYDPIYGVITFVSDRSKCTQRINGESEHIAGYLAWFELLNGFRKELYMTKAEVEHHALTYSKSYQYDKRSGKKSSRWSIDFDVMAAKTVIKRLLSQWGVLSVDMQTAMKEDQKVYNADGTGTYADNPAADIETTEAVAELPAAAFEPVEEPEARDEEDIASLFSEGSMT